jgi:hypothetical protein
MERYHVQWNSDFTACTQLLRAGAIIFPIHLYPESEIKDHIQTQCQHACGNIPQPRFDQAVPAIVLLFFHNLTEKSRVPFVGSRPERRILLFKLSCQGRFS